MLVDRVACRAGQVVDHGAFTSDSFVQERRLSNVRAADESHSSWSTDFLLRHVADLRQHLHGCIEHVSNASSVQGRNRVWLTQTERPEAGRFWFLARVIDLVSNEDDRLLAGAEHFDHALIGRGWAYGCVNHEEHGVGELDRDFRLESDAQVYALGIWLPASGVDERELALVPFGFVRDAVASHARLVFDDSLTTAQDAVHECRLSHVGSADDGQHRQSRQINGTVELVEFDVENIEVFDLKFIVV